MVASSRQDLSEWALHFIHDRNIDNEPDDQMIDFSFYDGYPYHENRDVNSRFDFWNVVDEESNLAVDGSAFAVLLKIIRDGHIRASWAFRNRRPTVYGPRAAVCFTEMPLYALVDYSRNRGPMNVGNYAVGVLRHELFASGGRPVIYGLSGKHIEQRPEALLVTYGHGSSIHLVVWSKTNSIAMSLCQLMQKSRSIGHTKESGGGLITRIFVHVQVYPYGWTTNRLGSAVYLLWFRIRPR